MAKVLVVEDDKLSQKVLTKVLTNAGHECIVSDSTQAGWDRLQEHVLVDLIVLDNRLGHEWGWQFLRVLRNSPAYRGVPVIVYTAHTERSSIIRYVEMGVQSMHVKPYQAEVLLEELRKAIAINWPEKVMEATETICARLNLNTAEYTSLLATATRTVEEALKEARRRLVSPNDTLLINALNSIDQQGRSVGIPIIESVIDKIKACIHEEDIEKAVEEMRSVEAFLGMIRHRMLGLMSMGGAIARTTVPSGSDPAPALIAAAPEKAATFAAAYTREIVQKPLWQMGPHLKRLLQHRLVGDDELTTTITRCVADAPFKPLREVIDQLANIPTMSVADAVALVQNTPQFTVRYRTILERTTGINEPLTNLTAITKTVSQQGIGKVVTLAGIAQIAHHLPKGGPLQLRQLYTHSLGASLLALEIGRMFKISNSHLLAAAGLAHDTGRWLLALGEPGTYALALSLSQDGAISVEDAEVSLFGYDHHAVGVRVLAALEQSPLLQATAASHRDPSKVTNEEHIITVAVVHIAHLMTQAALTSNTDESKALLQQLQSPTYPAWTLFNAHGVHLPFETPELVDTLTAISGTTAWIASELLNA